MRLLLLTLLSFSAFALHCEGESMLWHKLLIGADLAEERLIGLDSNDYARVAVVDTGFDKKSAMAYPPVSLFKGAPEAGDPGVDHVGHGSAVMGVIVAKLTGVTQKAIVSAYRITKDGPAGTATDEALDQAVIKACASNDIINLSFGSVDLQIGEEYYKDQGWFKHARDMGCLVITSAGNSSIKYGTNEEIPLEAPVLTVEASNQFSDEALFSSQGMMSAPGDGVYSVLSVDSQDLKDGYIEKKCDIEGTLYTSFRGTSFSSPMVSGVAAQVVGMLKSRNMLPAEPSKRIAQIKSILLASTKVSSSLGDSGVVNALAAVTIAENIKSYNVDIEQLAEIGRRDCRRGKDFDDDLFNLLVCKSGTHTDRLFESMESRNESELMVTLINKSKGIAKRKVSKFQKALWEGNLEDGEVTQYGLALDILESSVHARTNLMKSRNFLLLKEHRKFKTLFGWEEAILNKYNEYLRARTLKIFEALNFFDKLDVIKVMSESTSANDFVFMLFLEDKGDLGFIVGKRVEKLNKDLWEKWFEGELKLD